MSPRGRDLELTSLHPGWFRNVASTLHVVISLDEVAIGAIATPAVGGTVTAIDVAGAIATSLLEQTLARLAVRRLAREPLSAQPRSGADSGDLAGIQTGRRADLALLIAELDLDPPATLTPEGHVESGTHRHETATQPKRGSARWDRVAVRTVAVDAPLELLEGLEGWTRVRVTFTRDGRPFGHADLLPHNGTLSARQLREAAAHAWLTVLLAGYGRIAARAALGRWLGARVNPSAPPSVSVVVATLDRPEDLRTCLTALAAQRYDGPLEIIVVDNAPGSGLTPPVVSGFAGVRLVREPRRGLSYARNAGFRAATGDILVTTDDDVTMEPEWVARLVAPFARPDVALVTGNTLAGELDTPAQRRFERYGGLGRGYTSREFDRAWLLSGWAAAPTWELGATANAAFRARSLSRPDIGFLPDWLGPGTPTGVGEDTFLFYRILAAGFTGVYEPGAFVWHRHRRDDRALQRQLFDYSSGHVGYLLSLWLRERDPRGLARLAVHLPVHHLRAVSRWVTGDRDWPLSLIATEVAGNLAGPWRLWRSFRRARRLADAGDDR